MKSILLTKQSNLSLHFKLKQLAFSGYAQKIDKIRKVDQDLKVREIEAQIASFIVFNVTCMMRLCVLYAPTLTHTRGWTSSVYKHDKRGNCNFYD